MTPMAVEPVRKIKFVMRREERNNPFFLSTKMKKDNQNNILPHMLIICMHEIKEKKLISIFSAKARELDFPNLYLNQTFIFLSNHKKIFWWQIHNISYKLKRGLQAIISPNHHQHTYQLLDAINHDKLLLTRISFRYKNFKGTHSFVRLACENQMQLKEIKQKNYDIKPEKC